VQGRTFTQPHTYTHTHTSTAKSFWQLLFRLLSLWAKKVFYAFAAVSFFVLTVGKQSIIFNLNLAMQTLLHMPSYTPYTPYKTEAHTKKDTCV